MDLKLSEDRLKEQFEAKLQGRDKVLTDCDHKIESLQAAVLADLKDMKSMIDSNTLANEAQQKKDETKKQLEHDIEVLKKIVTKNEKDL